jgi:hypothetical protein
MTRGESKMMQGVGILTMIFYHLFNPSFHHEYVSTVTGNMGRAANPVSLYCLLSGYGLHIVFSRNSSGHQALRSFRLYLRYWLITALFVFVEGFIIRDQRCSFSLIEILSNFADWKANYYPPAWFVLPYCMLALLSSWIYKVTDKLNIWVVLLLSYGVYLFASQMNRFSWFGLNFFQTLYIFFPFVLGAVMAKTGLVDRCDNFLSKRSIWVTLLPLALLLVLRYYVYTGAVASFFWAGLVVLMVTLIRRIESCARILLFFGQHNLNLWMIHAWVCWYLLNGFIYSLGNPILMFITVLGISLAISIVLNVVIIPLESKILREHAK